MYDYNPDTAKALIAQSGVDMGSLPTFTFDTYYNDPLSLNVMTAIQQNWADIGFNVTIKQMDSAAWTNQYYKQGTSQVSFIGAQNGPDGNIAATYFLSTASQEAGAGNNGADGAEGRSIRGPEWELLTAQSPPESPPAAPVIARPRGSRGSAPASATRREVSLST